MKPVLRLQEQIKNKSIHIESINVIKCRCCNDKMPTVKTLRFEKNGFSSTKTYKGKRTGFLRRMNFKQDQVDQAVELLIQYIKANPNFLKKVHCEVTKEGVAAILQVPEHQVKVSFQKLNLEGVISQSNNIPPHDSKRDFWFWGGNDSSWAASTYKIL